MNPRATLSLLLASALAGLLPAQEAPPPERLFSFRAEALPIQQALALFARANKLNVIPDQDVQGEVTVEFTDLPLDEAMNALLDAGGFYFEKDRGILRVKRTETRLFHIDYIQTIRAGQGSNAVQISSGGGSQSGTTGGASTGAAGGLDQPEGSSMTVTNSATIDFWGDLSEQLKTLVSPGGSFSLNRLAGTVLVRDSRRNIEMIALYLNRVTQAVIRQVDLEVRIYEVALSDAFQFGVNWQLVSERLSGAVGTIPGGLNLPDSAGLIVQTPAFGSAPGAPGIRFASSSSDLSVVVDALKQQGNLRVLSKPRLRTLNNQPAVVRIGQDLPVFVRQVVQSPGNPPVISTNESIQTVTVGTVLSITPQISEDGIVTLEITPAVSRLVRTETSASGQTNAPVIEIRQASSIVRVRDGATIVMGGLVQESTAQTKRKVPLLGDIPLLGKAFSGTYNTSERTELIFVLTPRVVDPSRDGTDTPVLPETVLPARLSRKDPAPAGR